MTEKQEFDLTQTTDKTIAEILGIDEKQAEQVKEFARDMPQSVTVPETPGKIFVTFQNSKIEIVEKEKEVEVSELIEGVLKKRTTNAMVKMPLIRVKDDDGVPLTLWLTAGSAKREFMKLIYRLKDVSGIRVAIWREKYQHKQFGEVIAYRMQQVDPKQ